MDRLVPETTSFALIFTAWLSPRHDTYPKFPRSPLGTPGTTTPFWRAENEKASENYIEDITRWREDMNFIFEWQNNILRTSAASE